MGGVSSLEEIPGPGETRNYYSILFFFSQNNYFSSVLTTPHFFNSSVEFIAEFLYQFILFCTIWLLFSTI